MSVGSIVVGMSVGSIVVGMSVGSYVVGGSLKDCSMRFETLSLVSDTIEDTEKMCKQSLTLAHMLLLDT